MPDRVAIVAANIRARRDELEWSQHEAAQACGMGLVQFGRIERGEIDVRLSTLDRIAEGLGVTAADLLTPRA